MLLTLEARAPILNLIQLHSISAYGKALHTLEAPQTRDVRCHMKFVRMIRAQLVRLDAADML